MIVYLQHLHISARASACKIRPKRYLAFQQNSKVLTQNSASIGAKPFNSDFAAGGFCTIRRDWYTRRTQKAIQVGLHFDVWHRTENVGIGVIIQASYSCRLPGLRVRFRIDRSEIVSRSQVQHLCMNARFKFNSECMCQRSYIPAKGLWIKELLYNISARYRIAFKQVS